MLGDPTTGCNQTTTEAATGTIRTASATAAGGDTSWGG